MPTSQYRSLPYAPISAPAAVNPIGFNNTGDPRKAAQSQRQLVQGQGDALQAQDADLANQYRDQAGGTEAYLNDIQDPLARGEGGYNSTESAAINLSPQEKQNIVTGAGISAGANTAAAVGAAERASAAAGGSPAALATYRARAAQTQGAQAGDAMTAARVAAKTAESSGAQATGNARLGQQNTALNYYGGLQGQKNQNAQNEQGLQHGAFGTTTAGTGAATGQVLSASQTPSTFDKVLGAAAGAAKAFVADGTDGYLDNDGMEAVVGEDGPEAIIEAIPRPAGTRVAGMPRRYMADGEDGMEGQPPGGEVQYGDDRVGKGGALKDYLAKSRQRAGTPAQSAPEQWNKATPYAQAGEAAGAGAAAAIAAGFLADGDNGGGSSDGNDSPWWKDLATYGIKSAAHSILPSVFAADGCTYRSRPMMADGGSEPMANGFSAVIPPPAAPAAPKIITSPTRVHLDPGDQVVPLSYRSRAKVRPSIAVSAFMPHGAHGA